MYKFFHFLQLFVRGMVYFNQQPNPTYSAVIVSNGKITPLHCLYISVPYIDTEACKIDSFFIQSSKSQIVLFFQLFVCLFPFLH